MDDFRNIVNANTEIRRLESQLTAAEEEIRRQKQRVVDWKKDYDRVSSQLNEARAALETLNTG